MGILDAPINPNAGLFLPRTAADRTSRGRVLFQEDFVHPVLGMWNDGIGCAYRDTNVTFAGRPTMRLDPQGTTATAGSGPATMGPSNYVICKRRIIDQFSGVFAVSLWLRFTSSSSAINSYTTISVYNRDSANAYYGRLWLDTSGDNSAGTYNAGAPKTLLAKTLGTDGTTWTTRGTILNQGTDEHSYKPSGNFVDKTGLWWFVKLAVNLNTKKYVYAQVADQFVDLTGLDIFTSAATSQSVMHFSVEYGATSGSPARRYINVASVTGTAE